MALLFAAYSFSAMPSYGVAARNGNMPTYRRAVKAKVAIFIRTDVTVAGWCNSVGRRPPNCDGV